MSRGEREHTTWKRPDYAGDARRFSNEQAANFGIGGLTSDELRASVSKMAARLFEHDILSESDFIEVIGYGFERTEPSHG